MSPKKRIIVHPKSISSYSYAINLARLLKIQSKQKLCRPWIKVLNPHALNLNACLFQLRSSIYMYSRVP